MNSTVPLISAYETGRLNIMPWFSRKMSILIGKMGIDEKHLDEPLEKVYLGKQEGKRKKVSVKKSPFEAVTKEAPESSHYGDKIDVIDWAEANLSKEELIGFYRVNAVKYIARYGFKQGFNDVDLKKATFYIDKLTKAKK